MARLDPPEILHLLDSGSFGFSFGGWSFCHSCMQCSEQNCLDLATESLFVLVYSEQLRQRTMPSGERPEV